VRRALVTGATGLVGSYLIERLLADGWNTRALVRSPSRADGLHARGVELSEGNVLDAASLVRAAAGCDVVFHAAAAVTADGGWDEYRATNIDGTRNVIAAVRAAGARLLHVSSVAVYGAGDRYRAGRLTGEDAPLPPLPPRAFYARSKRESEALVLDAHARGEIWATAIRPDVIYGRGDRQFTPRIARILRHGVGFVAGGGQTTLPIVHAANVADAAVRAVSIDAAGGRAYNTANDYDVTVARFFQLAGEGLGRTMRLVSVPVWILRLVLPTAIRLRAIGGSRGQPVSASASVDFATRDNPFTSQRARTELGWNPPVRPEAGVPESFRWWKEHTADE
jgi:nucleoside-diphosphate-sugar epimerase